MPDIVKMPKNSRGNDLADYPDDKKIKAQLNAEIDAIMVPPETSVLDEPASQIADEIYSATDIDISAIPPRDWVYDELALSGYITTVIAPGGTGKSVLTIVMAISVALGRELIDGLTVPQARNVLLLTGSIRHGG